MFSRFHFCTFILVTFSFLLSTTLGANIIRKGNLIIDLDTGKITMTNENAEYQSLLIDAPNTSTGSSNTSTGSSKPTTGNNTTGVQNDSVPSPTGGARGEGELESAIARGYENELTVYDSIADFKPDNAITREQAAKFLSQASVLLEYNPTNTGTSCIFEDFLKTNESLKPHVLTACKLKLMKGDGKNFRPWSPLTHAEAITVLARMSYFEFTGDTKKVIRWTPYFSFIKGLGILGGTTTNETTIDKSITRGELIILLYKLAKKDDLVLDDTSDTTNITPNSSVPSQTEEAKKETSTGSRSTLSLGAGITDDPEFTTALLWMNNAGMTKYRKAADYNPLAPLLREQAAQFLSIYDSKFDTHTTTNSGSCTFTDTADSTFQDSIASICAKGIIKGSNNKFNPTNAMTKAEFVASLLNMLNEYPQATGSRSENVYNKALSLDMIARADKATFDKPITRYEAAIMFSKLYLKQQFTKSLSDSDASYNIISEIKDNNPSISGQQKVFIDINTLDSSDFTNGFVTLFGENYKLTKKQIIQYFPTSYVRYGEISDVADDTILGSISMSIGQKGISKNLIEGYIARADGSAYYTITSTNQIPYYLITKAK